MTLAPQVCPPPATRRALLPCSVLNWGGAAAWGSDPCVTTILTLQLQAESFQRVETASLPPNEELPWAKRGLGCVVSSLCLLLAPKTCQLMRILASRGCPSVFPLLSPDIT